MNKASRFFFSILLAVAVLCSCTAAPVDNPAISARLEAIPVVRVNCYPNNNNSYYGSGIIIKKTGVILTASHCLYKNSKVDVNLDSLVHYNSASPIPGKNFPGDDVAFIKVDNAANLKTARLHKEKYSPSSLAGKQVYLKGHRRGGKNNIISGHVYGGYSLTIIAWLGKIINNLTGYSSPKNLITERKINNCLFVKINEKHIAGMSGGAIIAGGKVIAMIIEEWDILGAVYAIGVPIFRCLELYHRPKKQKRPK